ncbi:MAG: NAD(P)/FAD-dependent oxidoreductase [Chloroflexota bacterium]
MAGGVKTVLVLGGGVGGLVVANALRRQLQRRHRILLVERQDRHLYAPSLLWLAVGARRADQVQKDVRRMVAPGVEVLRAEVTTIDPAGQRVLTSAGEQRYDYLVVALGADLAPEAMPGFAEAAHNVYDLAGAAAMARALSDLAGGRIAVAISSLPFKCPAAPYEAALLVDDALRRRGLRGSVELDVYTPEPQPMPVAGPAVGDAVRAMLGQQGIRYHPNTPLAAIDPGRRELSFQDGTTAPFDLLVGVPPHRPPGVIRESPLANEAGWIPVHNRTLVTRFPNVYAIGDVTAVVLPNGKLLPKAGVFAHAQGLAVASALAAQLNNAEEREFDGVGYCWVSMARGRAGFALGSFYAEPAPRMDLRRPGRLWHFGKVLFEKYWMGDGLERAAAGLALRVGGQMLGVPASL